VQAQRDLRIEVEYFFGATKGSCGFMNPAAMIQGPSPSLSISVLTAPAIWPSG
jgi:hypothetical protein